MMNKFTDFMLSLMAYATWTILIVFLLFCAYVFVAWGPTSLYAEAECLAAGYPKHQVSVGLERYCMNLEGTITVSVKKLK